MRHAPQKTPAWYVAAFALALVGCDQSQPGGPIELALSGTPTYQIQNQQTGGNNGTGVVSIVVIVNEIDAHVGGAWVPLTKVPKTIDLSKLDNTTSTSLGFTTLPAGHIDQLRFLLDEIGDYVVLKDGTKKPLEVPANGIVKVDGKLDVDPCAAGVVIVDFDPGLKTEDEPGRREYELLPVAKIKTVKTLGSCTGSDAGNPKPDAGSTPDAGGSCAGVLCGAGEVCQGGQCVADPCNNVLCGANEMCVAGKCVVKDPCAGVTCGAGETCSNGTCIAAPPADMGSSHDGASCHH